MLGIAAADAVSRTVKQTRELIQGIRAKMIEAGLHTLKRKSNLLLNERVVVFGEVDISTRHVGTRSLAIFQQGWQEGQVLPT